MLSQSQVVGIRRKRDLIRLPFHALWPPAGLPKDTGLGLIELEEFCEHRAEIGGYASILNPDNQPIMRLQDQRDAKDTLRRAPALRDQSGKLKSELGKLEARLTAALKQQVFRDAEAAKMLGDLKMCMTPEPWSKLGVIKDKFPGEHEAAYKEVWKHMRRNWFGEAADRKASSLSEIAEVGHALNVQQLSMVILQLDLAFDLEYKLLIDSEGYLYDRAYPLMSNDAMLRELQKRICHTDLNEYRTLVKRFIKDSTRWRDAGMELEEEIGREVRLITDAVVPRGHQQHQHQQQQHQHQQQQHQQQAAHFGSVYEHPEMLALAARIGAQQGGGGAPPLHTSFTTPADLTGHDAGGNGAGGHGTGGYGAGGHGTGGYGGDVPAFKVQRTEQRAPNFMPPPCRLYNPATGVCAWDEQHPDKKCIYGHYGGPQQPAGNPPPPPPQYPPPFLPPQHQQQLQQHLQQAPQQQAPGHGPGSGSGPPSGSAPLPVSGVSGVSGVPAPAANRGVGNYIVGCLGATPGGPALSSQIRAPAIAPSARASLLRTTTVALVALTEIVVTTDTSPELTAVSDSGCTCAIVSTKTYNDLREREAIPPMSPLRPHQRGMSVAFGKVGSSEPILGEVRMPGRVLSSLFVVNDITETLVGDNVFADKGFIQLKDASNVVWLYQGQPIFSGTRLPPSQSWTLDLEQLCLLHDPRRDDAVTLSLPQMLSVLATAEGASEAATPANTALLGPLGPADVVVENDCSYEAATNSSDTQKELWDDSVSWGSKSTRYELDVHQQQQRQLALVTKPAKRVSKVTVRDAHDAHRKSGLSFSTMGNIVRTKAWRDIPEAFTEDLMRGLAEGPCDASGIGFALAHLRKPGPAEGSGIAPALGTTISFDLQGKHTATADGTLCFAVLLTEVFCKYTRVYLIKSKDCVYGAVVKFVAELKSFNFIVKVALCDAAGEVGDAFKTAAARLGITVRKSAPEHFGPGGHERVVQSIKSDFIGRLLSQNNLTVKYWGYGLMDAAEKRNACLKDSHPTMTPHEQITGKAPLYEQLTAFAFGDLAASPVLEQDKSSFTPRFELVAVLGSPNSIPGTHLVLRQHSKVAVIRRHLKPVGQPHQRVLTPEQWQLVQPVYDDEGNLTDFHALAQKNFNLKDVTDEAYDRQHSVTADDTNDAALGPHNCSVGPDGSLKPMSAPRSSARKLAEQERPNAVTTDDLLQQLGKDDTVGGTNARATDEAAPDAPSDEVLRPADADLLHQVIRLENDLGVVSFGTVTQLNANDRTAYVQYNKDTKLSKWYKIEDGEAGVNLWEFVYRPDPVDFAIPGISVSGETSSTDYKGQLNHQLLGRKVRLFFPDNGWFEGVVDFQQSPRVFSILYTDGDRADYNTNELKAMLIPLPGPPVPPPVRRAAPRVQPTNSSSSSSSNSIGGGGGSDGAAEEAQEPDVIGMPSEEECAQAVNAADGGAQPMDVDDAGENAEGADDAEADDDDAYDGDNAAALLVVWNGEGRDKLVDPTAASYDEVRACGNDGDCFATTLQTYLNDAADYYERPTFARAAKATYLLETKSVLALKARVQRGDENPTLSMVEKSQYLSSLYEPPMRAFIDTGLATGLHRFISNEERLNSDVKTVSHVNVFATKRIEPGQSLPRRTYRLTPHGGEEPLSDFEPGSTASAPADMTTILQAIAEASARDMAVSTADVKAAFPTHNKMDHPLNKNPRRVCTWLSSFQTGTGKGEWCEFLTLTNGFRDASRFFEDINAELMTSAGFTRSATCRSQWYMRLGDGLITVSIIVDDSLIFRTRNAMGKQLHDSLLDHLRKVGKFEMKVKELDDCPQGIDFCGFTICQVTNKYGRGVALTMPSMGLALTEQLVQLGATVSTGSWTTVAERSVELVSLLQQQCQQESVPVAQFPADNTYHALLRTLAMHEKTPTEAAQAVLAQLTTELAALGVTGKDGAWLPCNRDWDPISAAMERHAGKNAADQDAYLRLIGTLMWTTGVAPRSILPSQLSQYCSQPCGMDMACAVAAAQNFLLTSTVPLVFYVDPWAVERTIHYPLIHNVWTDAGEAKEPDGAGRKAVVAKVGHRGTPSGAFVAATSKVREGTTTVADEFEAYSDALPRVMVMRQLTEEFSGLRVDPYDTSATVLGSSSPTPIHGGQQLELTVTSDDPGNTGYPSRTEAIKRMQAAAARKELKRRVKVLTPEEAVQQQREETQRAERERQEYKQQSGGPTPVHTDSRMTAIVVIGDGTVNIKGLKPIVRLINAAHRAEYDGTAHVVQVTSQDNLANGLSKLPAGPLEYVMGLVGILGQSPEMDALQASALLKFGKSTRPALLSAEGMTHSDMRMTDDSEYPVYPPDVRDLQSEEPVVFRDPPFGLGHGDRHLHDEDARLPSALNSNPAAMAASLEWHDHTTPALRDNPKGHNLAYALYYKAHQAGDEPPAPITEQEAKEAYKKSGIGFERRLADLQRLHLQQEQNQRARDRAEELRQVNSSFDSAMSLRYSEAETRWLREFREHLQREIDARARARTTKRDHDGSLRGQSTAEVAYAMQRRLEQRVYGREELWRSSLHAPSSAVLEEQPSSKRTAPGSLGSSSSSSSSDSTMSSSGSSSSTSSSIAKHNYSYNIGSNSSSSGRPAKGQGSKARRADRRARERMSTYQ